MRTLLFAVVACLVLTTTVDAQHYRTLHLLEPLPDTVKAFSDFEYKEWALKHNAYAHENASLRAMGLEPAKDTMVIDRIFSNANNNPDQSIMINTVSPILNGVRFNRRNWSRGHRRTITTTYSQDRWGGGPVLLLNPYYRD